MAQLDTILIATSNPGKAHLIQELLKDLPIEFKTLKDLNLDPEFEEIGTTFEDNSLAKAQHFYRLSGLPTISDDSGLAIDALHGEPGVLSRRWPGHEATDQELVDMMIDKLQHIPEEQRTANFICVITLYVDPDHIYTARGESRGMMLLEPKAPLKAGIPWSSYFYYPDLEKVNSELTPEETLKYGHRGKAIKQLHNTLTKILHE
jgi:XTP/dITP diphosphohydrolase